MTFKEFIDTFIEDMDEDSDSVFIAKTKRWINRGYKELAKKEELEKIRIVEVVEGGFRKPYDSIKIKEVQYDDNPIMFKEEGNMVKVGVTGEVKVIYAYLPEPMVDNDDTPLTNPANDEFILNHAKYLYLMTEEELDMAKIYKNENDNFKINKYAKITKIIDVYGVI